MENSFVIVDFVGKSQQAYKDAAADGKVDFKDAIALIPLVVDLPKIVDAAPKAYEEIKAATRAQRQELYDRVIASLSIEKAEVEAFVANAIDWAVGTVQLITAGRMLRSVVSVHELPPQE